MQRYTDCPQILRDFLTYHETIKGQSQKTISEYYLDLRMFLRFIKLMRNDMPIDTPLEDIPIKDVDLEFIRTITTSEIFDFLSYLANDRVSRNRNRRCRQSQEALCHQILLQISYRKDQAIARKSCGRSGISKAAQKSAQIPNHGTIRGTATVRLRPK